MHLISQSFLHLFPQEQSKEIHGKFPTAIRFDRQPDSATGLFHGIIDVNFVYPALDAESDDCILCISRDTPAHFQTIPVFFDDFGERRFNHFQFFLKDVPPLDVLLPLRRLFRVFNPENTSSGGRRISSEKRIFIGQPSNRGNSRYYAMIFRAAARAPRSIGFPEGMPAGALRNNRLRRYSPGIGKNRRGRFVGHLPSDFHLQR
jgi:hypothetical protein